MAGRSRVELDPRFRRLMQRLPDDIVAPLKAAVAESGHDVYDAVARRIPVATRQLREDLGFRIGSGGLSVEIGYDRKRFPSQWKRSGWRAKFKEFGTKGYRRGDVRKVRGRKTTKVLRKDVKAQPAHPFMRPGFDATKRQIYERHRAAVATTLAKASSL